MKRVDFSRLFRSIYYNNCYFANCGYSYPYHRGHHNILVCEAKVKRNFLGFSDQSKYHLVYY